MIETTNAIKSQQTTLEYLQNPQTRVLSSVQICLEHKPNTSGISALLRHVDRAAQQNEKSRALA
jgi:hypothetical protein